ncbi:YybH family protein [Kordiimonas marina]|uniref:YybH family protein n=1 Tax=Kordiimonas marina TaxID=2872312 RepID=UPI001FF5E716|nr:nuclear transport factor 2 family protein [Kordiimonas marina]MCJ9429061.1 nuclear transport factor 2 family protein [Kordiimonas marina]
MRTLILAAATAASLSVPALAADKQEIILVDRAFAEMAADKGVKAAFSYYLAADAVKLDGGAFAVQGHDAIMKGFEGLPKDFKLTWWPKDGMVAESEDLAYTWGRYEVSYTAKDGTSKTGYGKYTTVWAKRGDDWKAILDTGNPSPGPSPQD